jgi:hypothetical protein
MDNSNNNNINNDESYNNNNNKIIKLHYKLIIVCKIMKIFFNK